MAYLIDTNVAIYLRDTDPYIQAQVLKLSDALFLSIISVVELEGGITKNPVAAGTRRLLLDRMLKTISILSFERKEARAYGRIVAQIGFSRTRILDRMIAAQALTIGATLITMNGPDFSDIPDLQLEIWPSPVPLP